MRKKPSTGGIVALVLVDLVLAWFTFRDLRRRPDSQVRGSKRLWRLATLANPGNSLAYWVIGRRRTESIDS